MRSSIIEPPSITVLVGCEETGFGVPEYRIHLSPVLKEYCCGSLADPEEPSVIRLPSDNPSHFSQILEALERKDFRIRIDLGDPPYNRLSPDGNVPLQMSNGAARTTLSAEPAAQELALHRSHCAITNLNQVYSLALKYEFLEVQGLVLKKLAYYIDPLTSPEAFLWKLDKMYKDTKGADGIVIPYVRKAINQIKKLRGEESEGLIQGSIKQGHELGFLIWNLCFGELANYYM